MRRALPVIALFLLAPLVGEVLLGATPVSRLGGLIPLSALYGGGAVLIRELARRRGNGWGSIALLGAVYGLLEEGIGVQSVFNPTLFNAGTLGARVFGVNGVWTEWTIGYHVVWSIAIPILLAEWLFPDRREEPWLGVPGTSAMAVLYALGLVAVSVIFRVIVTPGFHAPLAGEVGVVIVSAVLVAAALGRSADEVQPARRNDVTVPSPWLLGLIAFLASGLWFGLLALPEGLKHGPRVLLPMSLGVAMAAALYAGISRWSSSRAWTGIHALSLASGAMAVSMLFGFVAVTASNPIDHRGQGVVMTLAVALLLVFGRRLSMRERAARPRPAPVAVEAS